MTTRREARRPGHWLVAGVAIPLLALALPVPAENLVKTFTGSGPDTTERFAAEGPWRVDWEATSDHPLLAAFYTNLYDAETSEYLGFITQLRGTGSGSKLIRRSGTFRIGISGSDVDWTIGIVELSEEEAAVLEQAGTRRPAVRQVTGNPSKLITAGSFIGWNAVDETTLELVTGDDGLVQIVTFTEPCPALTDAESVLFVTPSSGATNVYDSILLEDGTRCYFGSVVSAYR